MNMKIIKFTKKLPTSTAATATATAAEATKKKFLSKNTE